MNEFKIIKKYKKNHERNLEICLNIARGNTYESTAEKFYLSYTSITVIYRSFVAEILHMAFSIPIEKAFYHKEYYQHHSLLRILSKYKEFYLKQ